MKLNRSKAVVPKKIFVVEDDPEILHVIKIMLGLEGYDVEVYPDGHGIIQNQTGVPDLYILDKLLPVIDGLDICSFLKSNEQTRHVPVIVISGAPYKKEALDVGAVKFIEKPFLMHSFLNSVANALNIHPKNKWFGF
jgi:DNA-binding response OmpR family regulator